jgi:transposase
MSPSTSTALPSKGGPDAGDGGMGRSRGKLTTKIHALVDADGRPVKLMLTPGQAGDAPAAASLLEDLAPGATLIADRAYDTNATRAFAAERGAWANIPPRSIRKGSFAFSSWVCRQRNLVERFFNRIKQFRGLATRYDRNPRTSSRVHLAVIRIWLAGI